MPPRSLVALLVVVVALLAAPVAGLGSPSQPAPGAPASGGTGPASVPAQQETTTAGPPGTATPNGTVTATPSSRATLPPSEEVWRVQLRPNGDARWRIAVTLPVRNAEDAAAFDELADEFGTVQNPLGVDFFRTAAARAGAETGRDMEISDVSRSTGRENGTGTLAVSFTWSNFARAEGDRLSVGDGFNTTRGTWLPRLSERQTLLVVPPSGYGVTSAPEVGITDGTARWEGPYDFDGREPWIVYSGDAPTPTPTATPTTTTPPGTNATETPDGGPIGALLPVAALAVLAGVSAAILVVYMRREDGDAGAVIPTTGGNSDDGAAAASTGGSDAGTSDGDGTGVGGSAGTGNASSGGRAGDAVAGGAAAGAAAGAAREDDDSDEDDGIDEELLSDEERVERLLERNGGRMKQANIVKETGWSNAKVSQLLSSMAEEGRIDKLRIGRENLISFPDEDVTDLDSSE